MRLSGCLFVSNERLNQYGPDIVCQFTLWFIYLLFNLDRINLSTSIIFKDAPIQREKSTKISKRWTMANFSFSEQQFWKKKLLIWICAQSTLKTLVFCTFQHVLFFYALGGLFLIYGEYILKSIYSQLSWGIILLLNP